MKTYEIVKVVNKENNKIIFNKNYVSEQDLKDFLYNLDLGDYGVIRENTWSVLPVSNIPIDNNLKENKNGND